MVRDWAAVRFLFRFLFSTCVCVIVSCLMQPFSLFVLLSSQMALILVSVLISAIPVAYCFPTAFQDLGGLSSEYQLLFCTPQLPPCRMSSCQRLLPALWQKTGLKSENRPSTLGSRWPVFPLCSVAPSLHHFILVKFQSACFFFSFSTYQKTGLPSSSWP